MTVGLAIEKVDINGILAIFLTDRSRAVAQFLHHETSAIHGVSLNLHSKRSVALLKKQNQIVVLTIFLAHRSRSFSTTKRQLYMVFR